MKIKRRHADLWWLRYYSQIVVDTMRAAAAEERKIKTKVDQNTKETKSGSAVDFPLDTRKSGQGRKVRND
jgi:hypothetical protein